MTTNLFDTPNSQQDVVVTNEDPRIVTLEDVKDLEPEVALKRLVDSQNYIAVLKAENAEARKSEERTVALEEAIRQLTEQSKQSANNSDGETPPGDVPPNEQNESTIKMEDIEQLVQTKISQTEQQRIVEANVQKVMTKMKEVWGNNYFQTLTAKAAELNSTPEQLNQLAATAPDVFIQAIGLNAPRQEAPISAPNSVMNTSISPGNTSNVRDWNYYQKMRKENPAQYRSGTTQMQMIEDIKALGDKFGLPT